MTTSRPDHQLRELRLRGAGGRAQCDETPVAQHRDPIRYREHFVELVADENDREALADELPQRGERDRGSPAA
jgi:hypothetical protein